MARGKVLVGGGDDRARRAARCACCRGAGPTRSSSTLQELRLQRRAAAAPISSRKIVPPWAAWKSPGLAWRASVKAPRSKPNSSASSSVSGMAAQLTSTNGPLARGAVAVDRVGASSPLPVPVSPRIRMGGSRRPGLAPERTRRAACARTSAIGALSPSSRLRLAMGCIVPASIARVKAKRARWPARARLCYRAASVATRRHGSERWPTTTWWWSGRGTRRWPPRSRRASRALAGWSCWRRRPASCAAATPTTAAGSCASPTTAPRICCRSVPDVEREVPGFSPASSRIRAKRFRADLDRVTEGRSDPELSEILIGRSFDTVRWMAAQGIVMEPAALAERRAGRRTPSSGRRAR